MCWGIQEVEDLSHILRESKESRPETLNISCPSSFRIYHVLRTSELAVHFREDSTEWRINQVAWLPRRRTCVDIYARSVEPWRCLASSSMSPYTTWPLTSERPLPARGFRKLPRKYDCVAYDSSRGFRGIRETSDSEELRLDRLVFWGTNLAEISSLLFPEVSHSLRSGIVTHVWAGVWVRARGATIICVRAWECARASRRYIFICVAKVQRAALFAASEV